MNLLASLLPGIREIRTPISVGALWLLTVWLGLAPHWDDLRRTNDGVATLVTSFDGVPHAYAAAGIVFACYVVGCVSVGLTTWLGTTLGRRLRMSGRLNPRISAALEAPAAQTRSLVRDIVSGQFARIGAPAGTWTYFPADPVLESLEVIALQLWQIAPAQYEHYDRTRAEGEIRAGIAFPIAALGTLLSVRVSWVALPVAIVLAGALVQQGYQLRQRSREVLAGAAYNDLIQVPLLDAVTKELQERAQPNWSPGTWMAATAAVLHHRGAFTAAHRYAHNAVVFRGDDEVLMVDFITYLDKHAPEVMDAVRAMPPAGT